MAREGRIWHARTKFGVLSGAAACTGLGGLQIRRTPVAGAVGLSALPPWRRARLHVSGCSLYERLGGGGGGDGPAMPLTSGRRRLLRGNSWNW
ncbi:hypothetical protein LY76DRAFT_200595 [Colletotrichum caudatum]|nr:hypothetical protein LY76DRAFT_200595 [Colletotrichum caudatum]